MSPEDPDVIIVSGFGGEGFKFATAISEFVSQYEDGPSGALILLVHPVLVQAVVWIPGRTDSLLAMFCLSGLWFYLVYFKENRRLDLFGYAFCLMGALLTKETGIALGFMVVLWDVWQSFKNKLRLREAWKVPALTSIVVFVWMLMNLLLTLQTLLL